MRVLIAYDGSPGATQAVALAESIAWPDGSVLRIGRVIEPVVMPIPGPWARGAAAPAPELENAITEYAEETTREVVQRLSAPDRSVEGVMLRGRAAGAIIDAARDLDADLIIVGSRGHGTITSLLLGSVSSEIVDQSLCPVLVARTTTLRRVVFATDGSPSARGAEARLARWPIFDGLPIDVVSVAHVVHPWSSAIAPKMYPQVLDAYEAELRAVKAEHARIATEAAARLRDAGRAVDVDMRGGDAGGEIIAVAEARGADLIVLGSRGRTGLTRLVLGSVARSVLSGSTSSVLIVRDGTEESEVVPAQG
jgi:nucleotide-binding universal stress UspA family protein